MVRREPALDLEEIKILSEKYIYYIVRTTCIVLKRFQFFLQPKPLLAGYSFIKQ